MSRFGVLAVLVVAQGSTRTPQRHLGGPELDFCFFLLPNSKAIFVSFGVVFDLFWVSLYFLVQFCFLYGALTLHFGSFVEAGNRSFGLGTPSAWTRMDPCGFDHHDLDPYGNLVVGEWG